MNSVKDIWTTLETRRHVPDFDLLRILSDQLKELGEEDMGSLFLLCAQKKRWPKYWSNAQRTDSDKRMWGWYEGGEEVINGQYWLPERLFKLLKGHVFEKGTKDYGSIRRAYEDLEQALRKAGELP